MPRETYRSENIFQTISRLAKETINRPHTAIFEGKMMGEPYSHFVVGELIIPEDITNINLVMENFKLVGKWNETLSINQNNTIHEKAKTLIVRAGDANIKGPQLLYLQPLMSIILDDGRIYHNTKIDPELRWLSSTLEFLKKIDGGKIPSKEKIEKACSSTRS
jgi:hypothetical protein